MSRQEPIERTPARKLRRLIVGALAIALLAAGCRATGSTGGSTSDGLVDIGAGLRGIAGLTATEYATGLENVSALAVDREGRLWAATASYEANGGDAVYLVTSSGAAPVAIVSGISTVMGLVWHDGALYVASSTGVDVYRGLDGTAFTEHETVLAVPDGTGLVGGLVLGTDGRLRLGISAPCDSCTPESSWSAAIVSFLPSGTDVQVEASGIRAPVGLAYFPGTDDLFVTMNQRDDLGADTPGDWLAVVNAGDTWGFPACYGQGGTACADAPDPVAELGKHAAASGVAIVTGQLGSAVGTAAVVAQWTKGTVLRITLDPSDPTAANEAEAFLSGFENPFGVVLAADGALFVGDWKAGTVYRIS